jgi:S-adenosylmethionine decarboxylase proenzyme
MQWGGLRGGLVGGFKTARGKGNNRYYIMGLHLIADIKQIRNTVLMNSPEELEEMLMGLCLLYGFNVLGKTEHRFEPQGYTLILLLAESHFSIHTFPEHNYVSIDLYTCREYDNKSIYEDIYYYLVDNFGALREKPVILKRFR